MKPAQRSCAFLSLAILSTSVFMVGMIGADAATIADDLVSAREHISYKAKVPQEFRKKQLVASIVIDATVSPDGTVTDAEVQQCRVGKRAGKWRDTLQHMCPRLEEETLKAVRKSTFHPATRDGSPVESSLRITRTLRNKG